MNSTRAVLVRTHAVSPALISIVLPSRFAGGGGSLPPAAQLVPPGSGLPVSDVFPSLRQAGKSRLSLRDARLTRSRQSGGPSRSRSRARAGSRGREWSESPVPRGRVADRGGRPPPSAPPRWAGLRRLRAPRPDRRDARRFGSARRAVGRAGPARATGRCGGMRSTAPPTGRRSGEPHRTLGRGGPRIGPPHRRGAAVAAPSPRGRHNSVRASSVRGSAVGGPPAWPTPRGGWRPRATAAARARRWTDGPAGGRGTDWVRSV